MIYGKASYVIHGRFTYTYTYHAFRIIVENHLLIGKLRNNAGRGYFWRKDVVGVNDEGLPNGRVEELGVTRGVLDAQYIGRRALR